MSKAAKKNNSDTSQKKPQPIEKQITKKAQSVIEENPVPSDNSDAELSDHEFIGEESDACSDDVFDSEPSVVDEDEIKDLVALEDLQAESADEGEEENILDEDAVPIQKVTKYNKPGILLALKKMQIENLDWIETQTFTATEPLVINDIHNDIDRELAFYGQALSAAELAIKKFKALNLPFTRPDDYFAEMVKSDEHMSKIRQKILDSAQSIKASEAARKQRELKKFGKQVQVEKIKERHLHKRQELERITNLKRKLKNNNGKDDFEIDLDEVPEVKSNKRSAKGDHKTNIKRLKKNETFGFGGKKRGAKRNTRDSSQSMKDGFDPRKNKTPFGGAKSKGGSKGSKPNRPGKARRKVSKK